MSNQGITSVKDFEKFPNLEVLWLNNNQVLFGDVVAVD